MSNFPANANGDPPMNAEFNIGDWAAGLSSSAAQSIPAEVGSFSSPGRRSPTRVLAGAQQANVKFSIHEGCRLLHPRQNPGRAAPARRGERPNLRGTYLRCA